jgi:hypothetical protein
MSLLLAEPTHGQDHGGIVGHPKLVPHLPALLTIKGARFCNLRAVIDNRHFIGRKTVVIA